MPRTSLMKKSDREPTSQERVTKMKIEEIKTPITQLSLIKADDPIFNIMLYII